MRTLRLLACFALASLVLGSFAVQRWLGQPPAGTAKGWPTLSITSVDATGATYELRNDTDRTFEVAAGLLGRPRPNLLHENSSEVCPVLGGVCGAGLGSGLLKPGDVETGRVALGGANHQHQLELALRPMVAEPWWQRINRWLGPTRPFEVANASKEPWVTVNSHSFSRAQNGAIR